MRRRLLLRGAAAVPAGWLCGCSLLPDRPYAERRQWPLGAETAAGAAALAAPAGPVLLVRTVRAGPGLTRRGLQVLQPDGSLQVLYYEEWAVPPAEAAEAALRRALAASGRFAAVTAPGSRLDPDYVLEGELERLLADPAQGSASAALALVLARTGPVRNRPVLQRSFAASVRLPAAKAGSGAGADAPVLAAAMQAALLDSIAAATASVAAVALPVRPA
jgi:ABC-type uncharacterized transport system auxiliary subunit